MNNDHDTPEALRRDVQVDFLRAVEKENSIAAFRILGATRLKSLITRTSKALLQPLTRKDSTTPFTVGKAEALLGFSAECTSMVALHIIEMKESHLTHIASLRMRLERLEHAFNEVITRTTEVE